VKQRLMTLADDVEDLASRCWSVVSETAVKALAKVIRRVADLLDGPPT
jgi:hypothetical protein